MSRTARLLTAVATLAATTGVVAPAGATTTVAPDTAPPKVEIVMDASGSMAEKADDGKPKIDAARTALTTVVNGLPADAHTGFRVYGATQPGIKDTPAACSDTQLVVPIGTNNQAALKAAIARYAPKGQTPTAYALEQAAKDLGTTGQRSIILVSDGEATCSKDPCVTAQQIAAQGVDVRIDVVGLRVGAKARKQLQCVADKGNGTYYDAADSAELTAALRAASIAARTPFAAEGRPVKGTDTPADAPTLTGGKYVDAMPTRGSDTKTYYKLHHTVPGSTMWVGVTTQMKHGLFSTLYATITNAKGDRCTGDVDVHNRVQSLVVTSHATTSGCTDGSDQYLTVSGKPDQIEPGQKVQLVVHEEPPATGANTSPSVKPSGNPTWSAMPAAGTPKPVAAVPSLDAAPLVTPGTYSLAIGPGSAAFVRVHVEWGQRIQVTSEQDWQPGGISLAQVLETQIVAPTGGRVSAVSPEGMPPARAFASEDGPALSSVTMATVNYANRNSPQPPEYGTARPGDYYVGISRGLPPGGEAQAASTVRLRIAVVGTAGEGAPDYQGSVPSSSAAQSNTQATTPNSTSTAGGATDVAGAPRAAAEPGRNWGLIGIAGGGAVLLAGAGTVLALALRKRP